MAKNRFLSNIGKRFSNFMGAPNDQNAFNQAFYKAIGGQGATYDTNQKTYIESGYNINSTVYAIVNQIATKSASVPLFIQNVNDKQQAKKFDYRRKHINLDKAHLERKAIKEIQKKAFDTVNDDPAFLPPPLDRPNPHQSWFEFFSLCETFLRTTGNIYLYMPSPKTGSTTGEPYAIYVLPSHLIEIVLKENADVMTDSNPVGYYMLTEGVQYSTFDAEEVVHISLSNPNYSQSGEHLYGQSPLRAALKNLETSNEANNQNIKTMKNSGVFGFVHGKSIPLQESQAKELKSRLTEMDNAEGRLSRIAGISSEIGFTRMSLTTTELQPFEYLGYSETQIANVLGWSVLLLNDVDGAKYDNLKQVRQRMITDTIMPDLGLIEEAFNTQILPRFKGYERSMCYFDYSLLPEMQADMSELVAWLTIALKDGVINRNEYREAISYASVSDSEFDEYTVQFGIMPLEDALAEQVDAVIDEEPMPPVDEVEEEIIEEEEI